MDKTYRWIVAGLFVFLSFLMLNRPVSFPAFKFESFGEFHPVSIEQREIVFSVISRLEAKKGITASSKKILSYLENETVEILVTNFASESKVVMKDGVGLVFPERFFESDPIDQEFVLSEWFREFAHSNWSDESYLAKIPKFKK